MSESHKGIRYSKERNESVSKGRIRYWDGRGREAYRRYIHFCNVRQYKKWRLAVFTKDNFACVNCQKVGGYLIAHHIKSWAKYLKLRYKINNGITLCKNCHSLTDNYKGKAVKLKWT